MQAGTASVSAEEANSGRADNSTRFIRFAALLFSIVFAVTAAALWGHIFQISDAEHYLRLANGDGTVMQPFASRQLGPILARTLATVSSITVEQAFVCQGIVALLLLAAFVFLCAPRALAGWFFPALAIVPFWPELFHDLALPDLVYAALLAIFLLLLKKRQWLAAAAMMFPLMLARESTSLTLLCLLIACWRELRWPGRLLALGAAGLGTLIVSHLTVHSTGNTEHLPGMLYLLLKAPWNAVRLSGVQPWSNQYQYICTEPRWQMPMHLRSISAVGVCGFTWETPLLALGAMTTTFGLLPLILAVAWRRSRQRNVIAAKEGQATTFVRFSPEIRFALLYGTASFMLAPVLGTAYTRLFGYAWPLMLVALPLLVTQPGVDAPLCNRRTALFLLHLVACAASIAGILAGAALGAAAWVLAALVLLRALDPKPSTASAPGKSEPTQA